MHKNHLESPLKHRFPDSSAEILIQQVCSGADEFTFRTIAQVMLILPIKPEDRISGSTDRSLEIHPILGRKAEWTGRDGGAGGYTGGNMQLLGSLIYYLSELGSKGINCK